MTLRFPYQATSPPGASAPPSRAMVVWRPLVPIRAFGPTGRSRTFGLALLDTGSVDTILPLAAARSLAAPLRNTGQIVRWRGVAYPVEFGDLELELADGTSTYRWMATVGFSPAPIAYLLLGSRGCLEFLDATFFGQARIAELDANQSFPGSIR